MIVVCFCGKGKERLRDVKEATQSLGKFKLLHSKTIAKVLDQSSLVQGRLVASKYPNLISQTGPLGDSVPWAAICGVGWG